MWRYVQEALFPKVTSRQMQVTPSPMLLEHLLGVVADLVDSKHATLTLSEVRCSSILWNTFLHILPTKLMFESIG